MTRRIAAPVYSWCRCLTSPTLTGVTTTSCDQAGRFPVSDGDGRHANAIAERTALETENERRICKQLAEHIADIVKRESVEGWSFAAPSSIHASITELLPSSIRNRVVEHVKSDLVKTEPSKLPTHFRSLQPL